MTALAMATQTVTWIQVEKPTFDLVGVVLGALGLAGLLAAVALVLGTVFGVGLILRHRQETTSRFEPFSLKLALPDR
jgi:hypothetical protein